ncbi:MAG: FadR/GntR family transcriptional regulator [Albidovulum sp.]
MRMDSPPAQDNDASGRMHDVIVMTMGRRIISNQYPSGGSLGNEMDLALTFQASRTAMREALKILSAKGLIESRPRVGTVVRPRESWNMLDPMVLGWALADPQQSQKVITDLYALRLAIEPVATRLAAQNHTEKDALAIRRALRGMATYVDHNDKVEQDLAFHMAILGATGNALFLSLGELISVGLKHVFHAGLDATADEDDRWIDRHQRVATALLARNGDEAAREMELLLAEAQRVHGKT